MWRSEVHTESANCCPDLVLSHSHDREALFGRHRFLLNGAWQKLTNKTKTWWASETEDLNVCVHPVQAGLLQLLSVFESRSKLICSPQWSWLAWALFFSTLYPFTYLLCTLFSVSSFYFWFLEDSKADLGPLWVISLPHCHNWLTPFSCVPWR